jgi:hypothetical protein
MISLCLVVVLMSTWDGDSGMSLWKAAADRDGMDRLAGPIRILVDLMVIGVFVMGVLGICLGACGIVKYLWTRERTMPRKPRRRKRR